MTVMIFESYIVACRQSPCTSCSSFFNFNLEVFVPSTASELNMIVGRWAWHGSRYCNISCSDSSKTLVAWARDLLLFACSPFSYWSEKIQWGWIWFHESVLPFSFIGQIHFVKLQRIFCSVFFQAKACSTASINRLKSLNRRTLDVLASRLYFYYSYSYELTGDLAEIRG